MPAGASTEQPVTILPNINAVGAKRRCDVAVVGRTFHADACRRCRPRNERASADYFREAVRYAAAAIFAGDMPDCAVQIPCYTAASRLPALVRRSEHQETTMPDDKNKPASGFQYSLANLKPVEPEQDRPHLSRRRQARISQKHHRPRYRQGHLAVAGQAHGGDGAGRRGQRPRRSDRARRENRVHRPRRCPRAGTDPARRRACAGRSGAVAVAGHPGHDRSGDRERLLLRLLPQRAVHAGRFRRDRKEDARDHRARQAVHQGSLDARKDQAGVPRQGRDVQGRTGRRHSRRRDRSRSTSRATGSISAAARI